MTWCHLSGGVIILDPSIPCKRGRPVLPPRFSAGAPCIGHPLEVGWPTNGPKSLRMLNNNLKIVQGKKYVDKFNSVYWRESVLFPYLQVHLGCARNPISTFACEVIPILQFQCDPKALCELSLPNRWKQVSGQGQHGQEVASVLLWGHVWRCLFGTHGEPAGVLQFPGIKNWI